MKTPDGGIAVAPSRALFLSRRVQVNVSLDTDYPFRDTLDLTVANIRITEFPKVAAPAASPVASRERPVRNARADRR